MSPTWFVLESTPSIIRTSNGCPAGIVTEPASLPPDDAVKLLTGVDGCAGAATAAWPEPRVNVSATMSLVEKVCTSPLISKRRIACVPPTNLPCKTRPSFNSNVSAAAAPVRAAPSTITPKNLINVFIRILLASAFRNPPYTNAYGFDDVARPEVVLLVSARVAPLSIRRRVQFLGNCGRQGVALLFIGNSPHQHHQHKWPLGKDNRSVMVNFGDVARFVSHTGPGRQTGGDRFVEFLPFQNGDHLLRRFGVHGFAFRNRGQQNSQPSRRRRVV